MKSFTWICILHANKQPLLFLLFFSKSPPHLSQKLIHLICGIKFDPKVNPNISSTFFVNTNLILILILSLILSLIRFGNTVLCETTNTSRYYLKQKAHQTPKCQKSKQKIITLLLLRPIGPSFQFHPPVHRSF